RTIAFAGGRIAKIGSRRAHWRSERSRNRWAKASGRPASRFFRARFVDGERPSFERLIVKLADRCLRLLLIGKFYESETSFFPSFAVQRNRDVRKISHRGE